MSLGYIATLKEQEVTYQPLLLIDITMFDGVTLLHVCSHNLNTGDGGFPYNGTSYLPRVINADDVMSQAMSQEGIDQPPSFNIKLNDADQFLWDNYELPIGFKAASVICTLVLWNVGTQNYSTDSIVIFSGICSAAKPGDSLLTLPIGSKINLANTQMPTIHLQSTCPWSFPSTAAQRLEGSDPNNDYSVYFNCGYSPDVQTGNGVGNWAETATLASSVSATANTFPISGTAPVPTGGQSGNTFLVAIGFQAFIGSECIQIIQFDSSNYYVLRGQNGTTATTHAAGAVIGMPYTACNFSRQNCIQRLGNAADRTYSFDGDIMHDSAGRGTGRGGMVQYQPPAMSISRGYISSKWDVIVNNQNESKYGDAIPMVYGDPCWVDPKIAVTQGDANFTWFQAILCSGQIDYVYNVVVNGERIPFAGGQGSLLPLVPVETNSSKTGRWTAINDGRRDGAYTIAAPFNGSYQDCYGGLAVLLIQVPIAVSGANSNPKITVQIGGSMIRVYTSATAFTRKISSNPTWCVVDVLHRAGIAPSQINIASAVAVAAQQDVQMAYKNINAQVVNTEPTQRAGVAGGVVPYSRFAISLAISNRRSAADIVRGIRSASNMIIIPNYADGTIAFNFKSTLCDQQPALATLNGHTASNATQAWISPTPTQTVGYGYPVYCFDESNIAKKQSSPETSFELQQTSIQQTTNIYSYAFQNIENKGNWDSATVVDIEDISRTNTPITGSFNADGPNTFDRVYRVARLKLAEGMRGNPRFDYLGEAIGDTGGTLLGTWETSFKGIHIQVGDIVSVTIQKKGIQNWLFRIASKSVTMNAKRLKFTASYHNDIWYVLQYGQDDAPLFTTPWALANSRNPLVWNPASSVLPAGTFPVANDSLFLPTDGSFALNQSYQTAADGTAIASLTASGVLPANQYASILPPMIGAQGATSNTGGTIPGGFTMFFAICTKTASGATYLLGAPTYVALCYIPAGTNTNTANFSIPIPNWEAPGYVAFAGRYVNKLTYQGDETTLNLTAGSATPSTATLVPSTVKLTAFNEGDWGIPDIEFAKVQFDVRRVDYGGVWWAFVSSTTSTTITISNAGWTTNQWAGYDISLVAKNGYNAGNVPIMNMRVASNNATTLTIQTTSPSPATINPLDVIVCRSLPTFSADANGNGIVTDANWINSLNPQAAAIPILEVTRSGTTITILTAEAHNYATGNYVVITNTSGVLGANGTFAITVTGSTTYTLTGATGSGATSDATGGDSALLLQGLQSVIGKVFRIFAGTGRGITMSITAYTQTSFTVDGPFLDTPDSTTRYWIEESAPDNSFNTATIVNRIPEAAVTQSLGVSNYDEQFLSIIGYAVDAGGILSNQALSPARDIFLLGASGYTVDKTVPPAPFAGIEVGAGYVHFTQPGFSTLLNTFSVTNITLQVFYYDLTLGTPATALSSSITSTASSVTINAIVTPYAGQIIQIEAELLVCLSYTVSGSTTVISVGRAAAGSTAASHASTTLVYFLVFKQFIKAFPMGFFYNRVVASSFDWTESLPNVRISLVELAATNAIGTGLTGYVPFTTAAGNGFFTSTFVNASLQVGVQVYGVLAIASNAASAAINFSLPDIATWASSGYIRAIVETAPTGAAVTVNLNVSGLTAPWATITIPATLLTAQLVTSALSGLQPIPAGSTLSIDIVSVGTTYPGANLSVWISEF